jgi:hypothetical protein
VAKKLLAHLAEPILSLKEAARDALPSSTASSGRWSPQPEDRHAGLQWYDLGLRNRGRYHLVFRLGLCSTSSSATFSAQQLLASRPRPANRQP